MDQMVSGLHGRYYETTRNGNVYTAASAAVATVIAGLNPTNYTGLCIANPLSSGVMAVLMKASMMQSVISVTTVTAMAIAIGYDPNNNVTQSTPLATKSALIGSGGNSKVLATVLITGTPSFTVAPTYHTFVANDPTKDLNTTGAVVDFEGSLVLMPGAYALWVSPVTATATNLWLGFQWEEVVIS